MRKLIGISAVLPLSISLGAVAEGKGDQDLVLAMNEKIAPPMVAVSPVMKDAGQVANKEQAEKLDAMLQEVSEKLNSRLEARIAERLNAISN